MPVTPTRQNIVFSTTRQWNPGDEFILRGIMNVFDALGVEYNPVIYNRNPDVRSMHQDLQLFKSSRVPEDFWRWERSSLLEANLKFGAFDNSIKPDTDCGFADWVVLAGTPEWCNRRVFDLYAHIFKYRLPVMILGVGGGFHPYRAEYRSVLERAKAFTVRDADTFQQVRDAGLNPSLLSCPALLSAGAHDETQVKQVRRIGLIYQASVDESVIWNGCSQQAYEFQRRLYDEILRRYGDSMQVDLVCHYVDELPLARRDFPQARLLYSFDSADYFKIYRQVDMVVGPRVHGIGAAASVGVPGVALTHDSRGKTCEGFLAESVQARGDISEAMAAVDRLIQNAEVRGRELLVHKAHTMDAYKKIVAQALEDRQVDYGAVALRADTTPYSLGTSAWMTLDSRLESASSRERPSWRTSARHMWRKLKRA